MDETELRLAKCFCSVFAELSVSTAPEADVNSVTEWDSIRTVTLFAVLKEEYGFDVDIDDVGSTLSFQGILSYIRKNKHNVSV
jgi:acyl carrier protein